MKEFSGGDARNRGVSGRGGESGPGFDGPGAEGGREEDWRGGSARNWWVLVLGEAEGPRTRMAALCLSSPLLFAA